MYDYLRHFEIGSAYVVPFNKMSAEVSKDIISSLSEKYDFNQRYVLMRDRMGNYVLKLKKESCISYEYSTYSSVILEVCRRYQLREYLLSSVSLAKYFSNTLIQKILDMLLQRCSCDERCCLGLVIKGGKTFQLVEVC